MIVNLTPEEIMLCEAFCYNLAVNQQRIEFGQKDTAARPVAEVSRDNLIGKLSELAFAKMCREVFGLSISLDFNLYPRGQWDGQDAVINSWKIDIKATRAGGKYLLIEFNKLCFRQQYNDLSDLFVMCLADWNRATDRPTGIIDVTGAISLHKLTKYNSNVLTLAKGKCIPNTKVPLQADNFAVHINNLEKDWNWIIKHITSCKPPSSACYQNPYSY